MPVFPVPSGTFAGMTQAQLLTMRVSAQEALTLIALGGKATALSYSQGDGARSVTYAMTSADGIRKLIRQINAALGVSGRRAIMVGFV